MPTMARAILWQLLVTGVVALAAALVGGAMAGMSALLGGLACVVPNALLAWRLTVEMRRPGGATVQGFFVGEFVKIAVTVLILFVVARTVPGLNWLALIVAFIAAMKSTFVMFLFGRTR